MLKRQVALTRARSTLTQIAKGGIRPGEVVEVTRRGRVVLILQRPEDFTRRASQHSRASKPGKLWGTAVILGDLEAASGRAEARVRAAVERRTKQI